MTTNTQQPSAVERAAALLRQAAKDLADGVTMPDGTPDWANEPDTKAAYDEHMAAAEALIEDEKRSLRAQLWSGNAQQSMVLAMQAAYIEWKHGSGSHSAMTWIANTLGGPGLIPDDAETDAQAFFDREGRNRRDARCCAQEGIRMTTTHTTLPAGWAIRISDEGYVTLTGPNRGEYTCVHDDEPNAAGQTLYALGRALAANAGDAAPDPTGRTPKDYAIEHAEYLAQASEGLLDAMNAVSEAEDAIEERDSDDAAQCDATDEQLESAREALSDAMSNIRGCVYEFRKRRDRALAAVPAAPQVAAAPAGYRLVPVEPTPAMVAAAETLFREERDHASEAHEPGDTFMGPSGESYYRAMLAAAPEVAAPQILEQRGPHWRDAPEWAQWLAFDRHGCWHWYQYEPACQRGEWACDGRHERAFPPGGWVNSAEPRPSMDADRAAQAACTGGAKA